MLLLHLSILWSSTGCRKHRILIDNITCRWMVGEKAISGTIGKKPYLPVQSVQCDGHQPDAGAMQGSSLSMPVEGPLRAAKRQALHSSCTTHAHLISNHVRLWRAAQQLDGGRWASATRTGAAPHISSITLLSRYHTTLLSRLTSPRTSRTHFRWLQNPIEGRHHHHPALTTAYCSALLPVEHLSQSLAP